MTNNRLEAQYLRPDATPYQTLFADAAQLPPAEFSTLQPRLENALTLFCHPQSQWRFMLLNAPETTPYMQLISQAFETLQAELPSLLHGSHYHIQRGLVTVEPVKQSDDPFAATANCFYQEWIEPEQLFGCVRLYQDEITLQPGLIHRVNGGILILSARTLLSQPLMWLRLKQMITQRRFQWFAADETRPLPVTIPDMPLDLRLMIIGSHASLGDFQDIEPDLYELALYSEFEGELALTGVEDMMLWCRYINQLADQYHVPRLAADAWPTLFNHVVRYSGDQCHLPLDPQWLTQQLTEAALYTNQPHIDNTTLTNALAARDWRESYLPERLYDDIELGQLLIDTEGEAVGQINGLSVLEYPGHPRVLGEPTRITCVVHFGDGEFTDVERKVELGGNLHAKGMMIMQAYLISELELDQQIPFSASLVFEQSYGEVDGDSASLAELCVLISALSQQPINQQIAVTGSVDQFGNVQPIGGINEKIEGFFEVCLRRGLTGKQGVILPVANVRHLCLRQDVVEAVQNQQFHLWAVDTAAEALPLLTGLPYSDEQKPCLLGAIQLRIAQAHALERPGYRWPFRWLNWFNRG